MSALWLGLLLAGEIAALWLLTRRVVPRLLGHRLALLLLAPATIAHELSHAFMALILGVPFGRRVGGRVTLFAPRREPDGSLTLGSVDVAQSDPLRGALIAIAPVIWVPLMIAALSRLLLGTFDPAAYFSALRVAPLWAALCWVVMMLLLPLAAFPSVGDHIGVLGGAALILAASSFLFVMHAVAGPAGLAQALGAGVLLLAPPAVAALALSGLHFARRGRHP